jgi:deoxyribodipyrimidine photo-lyase
MRKCGLIRTRFILESVANFRERLEKVGSKLLVSMEKPEDFIPTLLEKDCDNHVVYQEEICSEELAVEKAVKEACKKTEIHSLWGSTLYHIDDLPFHP